MTTPGPPNIKKFPLVFSSTLQYWWQPPSEGGADVTEYELTVGPEISTFRLPAGTTNWTVDGLSNDTFYSASIRATCNYPEWGPSSVFYDWQPGLPPSYAPQNVSSARISFTNAMVSWDPPAILPESPIFWYVIRSKSSNPNDPELSYTISGQTGTECFVEGVNPNSIYSFTVEAVNCPGYSPSVTTDSFNNIFLPSQLTSLQLWLDGQDGSTFICTRSSITQWNDKSGFSRNATPYQVSNPTFVSSLINNYSGVAISSNRALRAPMPIGTTSTTDPFVFVVFQKTGSADPLGRSETLVARTTANFPSPFDVYNTSRLRGNGLITGYTRIDSPIDIATIRQASLYSFTANINLWQEWLNASTVLYSTTPSLSFADAASYIYFGSREDNQTVFNGNLGEVVVYNSNITPFNRQKIEGYLSWKWGLPLPSTHPFYSLPPLASTIFSPMAYVSGIKLWYDGADPYANGTPPAEGQPVTTWVDKSGSGNNATAGVAATYVASSLTSPGYLSFNGTTTYYTIPNTSFILNQPFMIFIVDELSPYTGAPHILNGTPGILVRYTGTTTMAMDVAFSGNTLVDTISLWTNTTTWPSRVWSIVQSDTTREIYLNGDFGGSIATGALVSAWNGAEIGRQGTGNYYKGGLKEIMIVVGKPDDDMRQTIEGYLAWKWAVNNEFSRTNPYKNINPSQYPQTFTPLDVPTATLWLDAMDTTSFTYNTSGNLFLVSRWTNKARLGANSVTAATTSRPTRVKYGTNMWAVQFSGTQRFIGPDWANYVTPTTRTMFIVGLAESIGTNNPDPSQDIPFLGGTTINARVSIYLRGGGGVGTQGLIGAYNYGTSATVSTADYTVGDLILFSYELGGGNLYGRLNGTIDVTPTASAGNTVSLLDSFAIGVNRTSYYLTGKVMEVIIYSDMISTENRQKVEGYLAWKWGLQGKLPAEHPYKSGPPEYGGILA